MEKRGIMRIIEVIFAILIIATVVLTLASNRNQSAERDLSGVLPTLLEEIARDPEMRETILANNSEGSAENKVKFFLGKRIKNPSLNYDVRICNLDEVCGLEDYPVGVEDVFAAERVLSTTLKSTQEATPKKLKLFLWVKGD